MTRYKRVAYYMIYIFIASMFINFSFISTVNSKEYLVEETKVEKIIYLTFDDGPSTVTPKVLDVLKEKNVNATFFLIGNQIKGYEDVVKRIYDEGHSIGLHTYTHKFKNIYCSKEAFIKEMYICRDEIEKVVNVSPSIIRFPGGSRNRLNKEFLKELHNLNFKIYDWNMVMPDGMNPKASPDKLFREATKKIDNDNTIILLMHCDYMHGNTCKALPRIIDYYKKLGYTFKVINENTPEYYFSIKK